MVNEPQHFRCYMAKMKAFYGLAGLVATMSFLFCFVLLNCSNNEQLQNKLKKRKGNKQESAKNILKSEEM